MAADRVGLKTRVKKKEARFCGVQLGFDSALLMEYL